jgi:hypothetical protein
MGMRIIRNIRSQTQSEIFFSVDTSTVVDDIPLVAIAINPNRVKFLICNTGGENIYGGYSGSISDTSYSFLIEPTKTYIEDRFVFQGNIWIVSPLDSTYTCKEFV